MGSSACCVVRLPALPRAVLRRRWRKGILLRHSCCSAGLEPRGERPAHLHLRKLNCSRSSCCWRSPGAQPRDGREGGALRGKVSVAPATSGGYSPSARVRQCASARTATRQPFQLRGGTRTRRAATAAEAGRTAPQAAGTSRSSCCRRRCEAISSGAAPSLLSSCCCGRCCCFVPAPPSSLSRIRPQRRRECLHTARERLVPATPCLGSGGGGARMENTQAPVASGALRAQERQEQDASSRAARCGRAGARQRGPGAQQHATRAAPEAAAAPGHRNMCSCARARGVAGVASARRGPHGAATGAGAAAAVSTHGSVPLRHQQQQHERLLAETVAASSCATDTRQTSPPHRGHTTQRRRCGAAAGPRATAAAAAAASSRRGAPRRATQAHAGGAGEAAHRGLDGAPGPAAGHHGRAGHRLPLVRRGQGGAR